MFFNSIINKTRVFNTLTNNNVLYFVKFIIIGTFVYNKEQHAALFVIHLWFYSVYV